MKAFDPKSGPSSPEAPANAPGDRDASASQAPEASRPLNRLAREKSPYLLQHAGNPVDWYPWGAEALERAPANHLAFAAALDFALGPVSEITISAGASKQGIEGGSEASPSSAAAMLRAVRERYLPNIVLACRPAHGSEPLERLIPHTKAQVPLSGKSTAYVCRGYACLMPVHDVDALARQLDEE